MRKLIPLLISLNLAFAQHYVVSSVPTGQEGEKRFYDYYVLQFSSADKALYLAESLKARCGCPVWTYAGSFKGLEEWLRTRSAQCLLKQAQEVEYPKGFNRELFLEDLRQKLGEVKIYFKEDLPCTKKKDLKELLPQLRSLAREIATEVEKFYASRGEGGTP